MSGGGGMGGGQTTGQAAGRLYSACAVILFCLNSKKSSKVFFEPKNYPYLVFDPRVRNLNKKVQRYLLKVR